MDATGITEMIQSVGFPIVCCGGLFWYMYKQDEKHDEQVKELTQTINNNTIAITKLCDRLGVDFK